MKPKHSFIIVLNVTSPLILIDDKKEMLDYVTKHSGVLDPHSKQVAGKIMDNDFSSFNAAGHVVIYGQIRSIGLYRVPHLVSTLEKTPE